MQYSEGRIGRVFVLRLEEGDRIPETIEAFAQDKDIQNAMVLCLGGAADGSRVVVGPEMGRDDKIVPITYTLTGSQEIMGIGTLFRNEEDKPMLHMHAALGRDGEATVGCTRAGVPIWLVAEAVILEMQGISAMRKKDLKSGFELLRVLE